MIVGDKWLCGTRPALFASRDVARLTSSHHPHVVAVCAFLRGIMTDATPDASRMIERLTGSDSPLRDELVTLTVEHVLSLRMRDAVDLESVRAIVLSALSEASVQRIVERHVLPGYHRHARAIVGSGVIVGSLVPEAARARLHAIAAKLRLPRARWAQKAFDPALVRTLLAPVWTQVLMSFATRLPIPGLAGVVGQGPAAAGVTGLLARTAMQRAGKLVDRGKHVMGSLGIDVDKRLAEAAHGFSDTAAQIFRAALQERMTSDEGRALIARMASGVLDHVMATKIEDVQQDLDALPVDDVFAVVPQLIAYGAQTAYVKGIVQRELDSYLELEGERTLSALLEDLGVLESTRSALIAHGTAHATSFLRSARFADWLQRAIS
jgi:hypothetical protein